MVTALGLIASISSLLAVLLLIVVLRKQTPDLNQISQVQEELRISRTEASQNARELRQEVISQIKSTADTLVKTVGELGEAQGELLGVIGARVRELVESNESRLEKIRATLDKRMMDLQQSNEKRLDQMRQIVDEKLQSTLEKRLTESFKVVSDNLEAVQRGLGEMQALATGVGDLKRVLTNVKSRGTWGEVQLGALLEDILTPDQFERNVQIKDTSHEMVEYAIRLPGRDSKDAEAVVWLPIDAKFPQEDYQRVVEASEVGNVEGVKAASEALVRRLRDSARDIHDKYIVPPKTTDFAVMFLPTEGLYAELLRKPGLVEELQRKYRVVVAGPTTLAALLTSLRIGFRTLAIEKRSSEVWNVLAAVKTEFRKFGGVLAKLKKQLETASNTIDKTGVRARAMERKLRDLEELPLGKASEVLGIPELMESEEAQGDEETN